MFVKEATKPGQQLDDESGLALLRLQIWTFVVNLPPLLPCCHSAVPQHRQTSTDHRHFPKIR
jgi:hypothetical protein